MKTAEEAKREFADEWGDECLSDLNALISEHYTSKIAYKILSEHYQGVLASKDVEEDYIDKYYYPKEFVEWKDRNVLRHFNGWIFNYANSFKSRFKDTDELYEYWKENEK